MSKVQRIPHDKLPSLRDLFKKDWPRNILPYHLIHNYLDWHKKDQKFVEKSIEICCLDGDWSDGTFYFLDDKSLFFYTLNDDNLERLVTLLSFLPHDFEYLGGCIYERHLPAVDKVVDLIPDWERKFDTLTYLLYIPKEKGAEYDLDVPEGITVKPMYSYDHVTTIDSVHPFRTEGISVKNFEKLVKFNMNLGAFDADDKLLAWCLLYPTGVLHALQVLDDGKKRRGLGTLMVKAMAKASAEKGWDTFGCIVDGNLPSMNLFEKLGFDNIDRVHWTGFGSKNVTHWAASDPYADQKNGSA